MVAELHNWWQQRILDLRIQHLVLLLQAARYRIRFEPLFLLLQLPCMRSLRVVDRNSRFLSIVCFRQTYL